MNTFVCKVIVIDSKEQRVLKPRKIDEKENLNRFVRANSIKKNLFGMPDPCDTQQRLNEQRENDRKRFLDRFGFDIEEIENLENGENNENVGNGRQASKKCVGGRKILKGQRRVFKPHNGQASITDFYAARKNVPTEKTKQSKEN